MPSTAEIPDRDLDSLNTTLQESFQSWTNNLPVCGKSEIGFSINQVYQPSGVSKEEHGFEDRSFQYCLEGTCFYGVFDGHCGCRAADFLSQRMPPEILLGQLKDKTSDDEIKDLLRQAFLALETSFFQTIDNLLAEKEDLKSQLFTVKPHEVKKYPNAVQRLNKVTAEIQSGTAAVVALIIQNRLYVANVGDCRAILCKTNDASELETVQLSMDHNFKNHEELARLFQLGIPQEKLDSKFQTSASQLTRCLGNYVVKGGYKEFSVLSEASEEPIVAEPEVVGGIPLDNNCKFLILMSSGIYRTLEEANGTDNPNALIAEMLEEQLSKKGNLSDAVQAVVDEVGQIHYDAYMKNKRQSLQKRWDITLLVRQFDEYVPIPEVMYSDNGVYDDAPDLVDSTLEPDNPNTEQSPEEMKNDSSNGILSHDSTSSSDCAFVLPYVDFSDFRAAVEEAHKRGEVSDEWLEFN